jgi:hypothetical protein
MRGTHPHTPVELFGATLPQAGVAVPPLHDCAK